MHEWQVKRLTVSLKSPLRCGDSPLGFVARTLPFVPGHIPLMAMVPSAVDLLGYPAAPENYQLIQSFLEKSVRFTHFYIRDSQKGILFAYDPVKLRLIESNYIRSEQRVAIDYNDRSARDSMLFETEAVIPVLPDGKKTVLEGYMFFRPCRNDSLELTPDKGLNGVGLPDLISNSQWGGERNIGYGRIASVAVSEVESIWDSGRPAALDQETPEILWPENEPAPFWLAYRPNAPINGQVRPLSGRLFDAKKGENGSGQAVWNPEIAWDIGWKSTEKIQLKVGIKTVSI